MNEWDKSVIKWYEACDIQMHIMFNKDMIAK